MFICHLFFIRPPIPSSLQLLLFTENNCVDVISYVNAITNNVVRLQCQRLVCYSVFGYLLYVILTEAFFIKLGVSDSHMQGLKEEAAALFSRKWQRWTLMHSGGGISPRMPTEETVRGITCTGRGPTPGTFPRGPSTRYRQTRPNNTAIVTGSWMDCVQPPQKVRALGGWTPP